MAEEDVVGGVGMAEMVRLLLEDRRARDEELKEERRRREEMTLRAREAEQRAKEMQEQMALLRLLKPLARRTSGTGPLGTAE